MKTPAWIAGALLIFACAVALAFRSVIAEGVAVAVPIGNTEHFTVERDGWRFIRGVDVRLGASVVAHNARAWTHGLAGVFDAPHCAPAHNTLAMSDPLLALGLLGVPAELAGAEPIATYNFALASHLVISALAMALLVFDWTGVPAAALAAGLLYAFDLPRLRDVEHSFVYDTSWILLALYFTRRLLAFGRWRDAAGLAVATSLQIGTSLYAMLAAASVAGPVLAWGLWHYRLRHARPLQLALATSIVLLAAWFVFGPYLELRAAGDIQSRPQLFSHASDFAPGGIRALALSGVGLALAGLALPARYGLHPLRGDPRLALALGGCLAAALSTGPVFSGLSSWLPGLEVVRVPARVSNGVHLAACILAGIGFAALVRVVRPRAAAIAVQAALLGIVALESLALPNLAAGSGYRLEALAARPSDESLEFLAELARLGNSGPVLELPLEKGDEAILTHAPGRVLLAAYAHRRTSACIGSFIPQERLLLGEIVGQFQVNFAKLWVQGFTTVILHHTSPEEAPEKRWLDQMADQGKLRFLLSSPHHSAYQIEPVEMRIRPVIPPQAR